MTKKNMTDGENYYLGREKKIPWHNRLIDKLLMFTIFIIGGLLIIGMPDFVEIVAICLWGYLLLKFFYDDK